MPRFYWRMVLVLGAVDLVACVGHDSPPFVYDSGAPGDDAAMLDQAIRDVPAADTATGTDVPAADRAVATDVPPPRDTAVVAADAADVHVVSSSSDSCSATPPCDPISQTGCAAGQGCYANYGGSDGLTYLGVQCMSAGTHGDSQSCSTNNDCRPGYTCFIGLICMKICDPANGRGSSPDCTGQRSGLDCGSVDTTATCFGLCQNGYTGA